MIIEVEHIRKRFGTYEALKDVSLRIETGELVALLGPSGSGKTTLLRIIAGLELPDSGVIRLHDEDATKSTARDRQVGFVFQLFHLIPELTAHQNVLLPARMAGASNGTADRARELLEDWSRAVPCFVKVMPRDYKRALLQARERKTAKAVAAE